MKYIRTRDSQIIDCAKLLEDAKRHRLQNEDDIALANAIFNKKTTSKGWERRVEKVADNIKDLFDETIVDANYKDNPYLYDRDEPVDSPEFDSEDEVVYGAIWARGMHNEPILTPIAKLNSKGGWELI